jgi:tetratricopeptide (TPR) repeat protein
LLLAEIDLAEGRWDDAARRLHEALKRAERDISLQWRFRARTRLAELELMRGKPADGLERLAPLREDLVNDVDSEMTRDVLGWLLLAAGQEEEALRYVTRALSVLPQRGLRLELPGWLRLRGEIASRRGEIDEARQAFEEGLSIARSGGMPYAEARLLYQYGIALIRAGETEEARERLTTALATFTELGAGPFAEQAEYALNGLGES